MKTDKLLEYLNAMETVLRQAEILAALVTHEIDPGPEQKRHAERLLGTIKATRAIGKGN
jgi:hypothetical protein